MANPELRNFLPRRRMERIFMVVVAALTTVVVAPETVTLIRALQALVISLGG